MEPSILSLLPPVVTIGLAIATRRILLALGIGVVLGALMYSQWNIFASVSLIAEVAGGLILPIAAGIVVSVDLSLLIPAFGAVLAGAIFGDHTSPLSDTTILSSVGSGIQLIDHVTTQIPYALVCAVASLAGYVVLGFTRSTAAGLLTALAALVVAVFVLRARFASESEREPDAERVAG